MENKIILITGSHRSGSTWLGKTIAKHQTMKYVHEPFNIGYYKFEKPLTFWFEHISEHSEKHKQDQVLQYIKSFYESSFSVLAENVKRVNNLKDGYKLSKDIYERITTSNVLIKDPIAFFSADWISKSLNAQTIVLIRHPAAFVASIKLKNWTFDFHNFQKQDLLMEAYLLNYKKIIQEYANNQPDIIDQAICLWNIIHNTILQYEKLNPDWYFIKHEDLSIEPLIEFGKIFDYLSLDLTNEIRKEIINSTTSDQNTTLQRNSKENIKSWKKRLSEIEIARIKEQTYPIWSQFYDETDW